MSGSESGPTHGASGRRLLNTTALAALSGFAIGLAHLHASFYALAWLGLVPLLLGLRLASRTTAAIAGVVYALVVSIVAGYWFPEAVVRYFEQTPAIGILLYGLTILCTGGVYYALFGVVAAQCGTLPGALRPLLIAAAFAGAELLRVRLPGFVPFGIGNPWGILGYTQSAFLPGIQVADVLGVFGVSFGVVAMNAGLSEFWLHWRRREDPISDRLVACGIGVMTGLAFSLYGVAVLARADLSDIDARKPGSVRVGVVQGNLAISARWRLERRGENLDLYLLLSQELVESERPDVIVWPEAALTFDLEEPDDVQGLGSHLRDRARKLGAELVVGGPRRMSPKKSRYANSVFVVSSAGEVTGFYDKRVLIPLAEFDPLPFLGLQRRAFDAVPRYYAGRTRPPPESAAGRLGVLICQEAMFGEAASLRVSEGATLLVNPANDSWVGNADFARQQLAIVRLRAVEQRRDLIRASTAGPSAIVDRFGRILATTEPLVEGGTSAPVQPREDRSLYSRWGDAFGVACVFAAGASSVHVRRTGRARRDR